MCLWNLYICVYSGYEPFVRHMSCKYFLLICDLTIHFLNDVFWSLKFLILMMLRVIVPFSAYLECWLLKAYGHSFQENGSQPTRGISSRHNLGHALLKWLRQMTGCYCSTKGPVLWPLCETTLRGCLCPVFVGLDKAGLELTPLLCCASCPILLPLLLTDVSW